LEEDDELQLPDLVEDEAMEMAIDNSELDDLAKWDSLVVQLRASALAQGRPLTPPAPPPVAAPPAAAPSPPLVPQQPLHWPWLWAPSVYIDLVDNDEVGNHGARSASWLCDIAEKWVVWLGFFGEGMNGNEIVEEAA
jgi:hypothetical protein